MHFMAHTSKIIAQNIYSVIFNNLNINILIIHGRSLFLHTHNRTDFVFPLLIGLPTCDEYTTENLIGQKLETR